LVPEPVVWYGLSDILKGFSAEGEDTLGYQLERRDEKLQGARKQIVLYLL